MSEASATTSEEEARSFLRSSRLASLSPSCALSLKARNSWSFAFVSLVNSSALSCSPPSPFVLAVSVDYQVRRGEDLCRLLDLPNEGRGPLHALPLILLPERLDLAPLLRYPIPLGGQPPR